MATDRMPDRDRPRRPWLAFVLSLLHPGLGHLYAAQLRRALIIAAAFMLAGIAVVVLVLVAPGRWISLLIPLAFLATIGVAVDAAVMAKRAPHPFYLRPYNRWYVYLGVIVGLSALERLHPDVLEGFRLPSGSMSPTMLPGDWFYVDKRASARQTLTRGDLLAYRSPGEDITVIKRIVGVPDDTLVMRHDTLVRNGTPVIEPYVNWRRIAGDSAGTLEFGTWGPVVVPQRSVFVLGDDRHASKDSRHVGSIPFTNIIGRPVVIYYSYDSDAGPLSFLTAIRWNRLGMRPK